MYYCLVDKKHHIQTVVVYLKRDYSESHKFTCPASYSIHQVKHEVDKRYPEWYYFDIID